MSRKYDHYSNLHGLDYVNENKLKTVYCGNFVNVNSFYKKNSAHSLFWRQESCPLLRGCPHLGGWLVSHTPQSWGIERCGLPSRRSNQHRNAQNWPRMEQNQIHKRLKDFLDAMISKLLNFYIYLACVFISIHSWRLVCRSIANNRLWACYLFVVRSSEVVRISEAENVW